MLFAEDGLNALVTPVALLVGAGGVIAFLFRMIISEKDAKAKLIVEEKDRLIADLISERKTNKEIRDDAVKALLQQANWNRAQIGQPPIVVEPPVIPLSNSPSTEKQRDAADVQTAMATLAKLKREMGLEPKEEPEHAVEPGTPQTTPQTTLKEDIKRIPEETATKVVEKLKEPPTPTH